MPMKNTASKTLTVEFPDGPRVIPAYVKILEQSAFADNGFGVTARHAKLVPEPMDGYVFLESMDGTWKAYRETNW